MCGRYALTNPGEVITRFAVALPDPTWLRPRYNIAPGQTVLVVLEDQERRLDRFRWGLIPHWAKDAKVGYRMINARAETVHERPSFRRSLQHKRCLIPADGFFEWQGFGKEKTPIHIKLKSGQIFAFAGLYDSWRSPEGESVNSCTIITTSPNDLMAPIHDRMPVILDEEAEEAWLSPHIVEPEQLLPLLRPYPPQAMKAYPVSALVNSPRYDSPACIEPAE